MSDWVKKSLFILLTCILPVSVFVYLSWLDNYDLRSLFRLILSGPMLFILSASFFVMVAGYQDKTNGKNPIVQALYMFPIISLFVIKSLLIFILSASRFGFFDLPLMLPGLLIMLDLAISSYIILE